VTGPFDDQLIRAEAEGKLRRLREVASPQGRNIILEGRLALQFCSNDYLGLCSHPKVTQAARDCISEYGWGAGAARLISGAMTPHARLERAIALFLDKEAALLFGSGYAANTGVLTALAGRGAHIFADRLSHASIIDGALHSGAKLHRYEHNDPDSLAELLRAVPARGKRIVVTEGVFSMDGDISPLKQIVSVAKSHEAIMIVDDAHGFGLFGPQGRGSLHEAGVEGETDIHVVTLGKALGGFGGLVAASRRIIEGLINFSRPFIYSTALPPASSAAALAALEIVQGEEGQSRRQRLFRNAASALAALNGAGLRASSMTQIIPVLVGESEVAAGLSTALLGRGIYIPAIRPPTVPPGGARLRLSVMSEHEDEDFVKLKTALEAIGPMPGGR